MRDTTAATTSRSTSLRSRWNRILAILVAVFAVGVTLGVAGTALLTTAFERNAVRIEEQSVAIATLRGDILTHAALTDQTMEASDELAQQIAVLHTAVVSDFRQAIDASYPGKARRALESSFEKWQVVAAVIEGSYDRVRTEAELTTMATEFPPVMTLLDTSSEAGRAAGRKALADATRLKNGILAAMVAVGLLAVALMIGLARRLSREVLRPLEALRDSVNRLRDGNLGHRVVVERTDEFGTLEQSFNAMADAIAGTQTRLRRQANNDSLTGLVNRAGFRVHLESALTHGEPARPLAVLFADLDNFKPVNDELGHAAGDELLRVVAARLTRAVRPGDVVARFGGDEFALLLDGVDSPDAAYAVAERVVSMLSSPIEITGAEVQVGASVGLAMRQEDSTLESLLREADVAMYAAKALGKNRVVRFDEMSHDLDDEGESLRADVDRAVERDELVLAYQPIVDLADGRVLGVEALVRWQHPEKGLLPPSAFIGLAEQTGAVVGIDTWMLETAVGQLAQWQRRHGLPTLWLSVRISSARLEEPGFADAVLALLIHHGVDPRCLVLQLTESVVAYPGNRAAAALETLRATGVRIAVDEFGVDYASLDSLELLPVDMLKLDRSLVSGIDGDTGGDVLVEAITSVAGRIGLDVVPDGIEQPGQLARLRTLGCRMGQGLLLAEPRSGTAVDELLAAPVPLAVPMPPSEEGLDYQAVGNA